MTVFTAYSKGLWVFSWCHHFECQVDRCHVFNNSSQFVTENAQFSAIFIEWQVVISEDICGTGVE